MSSRWSRLERRAAPYLFISPFYIVFGAFFVLPILFALYISFTEWRGIGAPKFVGLANYVDIVGSKDVHSVLGNTLWYTIGSLCTILPFAFVLALLLNVRWNRYREAFRLVYFLPSIT
ncbi:MAG: sugar ABC transporter permease, partial [Chloroflexi bacterium]|nr:sugar ABC transporter permease [Chloroflexota bacterium]